MADKKRRDADKKQPAKQSTPAERKARARRDIEAGGYKNVDLVREKYLRGDYDRG